MRFIKFSQSILCGVELIDKSFPVREVEIVKM